MDGNLFEPHPESHVSEADRQKWDYAAGVLRALADWFDQQAAMASSLEARVTFSQAARRTHDQADTEWGRSR